jgi:hypothetical protein
MSSRDETISRQFREWEIRARGGRLFDHPVALEPPFVPFSGYRLPRRVVDDGKKPTALSRFWESLTAPPAKPESKEEEALEPAPTIRTPQPCAELQLTLPQTKPFPSSAYEGWLQQICRAGQPFSFELIGTEREVVPQFAGGPAVLERIYRALPLYLPEVTPLPSSSGLRSAWMESDSRFCAVTLGLGSEFVIPLADTKINILAAVVNALDGVRTDELGVYQVLIEPALHDWAESVVPAITGTDGNPIFCNRPELFKGAERKLVSPFLAVVVRFAAAAAHPGRCWQLIQDMVTPFAALADRGSNHLIPLSNDGYDPAVQENDILDRTSHKSGMLLNVAELLPFISLPTDAVSNRLRRLTLRTHPAPEELLRGGTLLLGQNPHAGRMPDVRLSPHHRVRHTHVIGSSGTGKSTLLFNMLKADIERGEGIALLDPHGDLLDRVLGIIPPSRIKDVVLVDPSDEEYVVGFNILAAHSDLERNLLASDLVSTFRRLSTSWGEQMNSVLRNAILAFLESSEGGTLADLRRFLIDDAYQKRFLRTVTDPDIVFYWEHAFAELTGNKSKGPVLTRLDEFLSRKPIRYMVSQKENRIDFAEIFDRSRILLVKLPQGQIGRENANLLGSVFVSKIQQTAIARQRMPESERRDFWVYIDEFHSFITPSMAEILTGARKYRVGLTLAHQELHQLDADRDVASAVLANCCTRIAFRVSDRDARELDSGFGHFGAKDLQNLGVGEAICRVERSDADFNLRVPEPTRIDERNTEATRNEVIARSRDRYARPRAEVEAEILNRTGNEARAKPRPPFTGAAQQPASEAQQPLRARPASTLKDDEQTAALSEEAASTEVGASFAFEDSAPPIGTPGRGGPEHKKLQQQVTAIAQELGFHAVTEKEVLSGAGHVDVSLDKDGLKIACEISVSTLLQGEVENVQKCLAAGYSMVITIASEKSQVVALAKRFKESFVAEDERRIYVCQPRALPTILKRMLRATKKPTREMERAGGYTIKRKHADDLTDREAEKIEADFMQILARVLQGE